MTVFHHWSRLWFVPILPAMIAGLAIILTALVLIPAGAHLFVLPNKIGRAQQDYFVAQSLYRGWALFEIVLISAFAANITRSVVWHGQGMNAYLAGAAALCMGVTLAIFFTRLRRGLMVGDPIIAVGA